MELYDYEMELQCEFACWICSHGHNSWMDFYPEPRHLEIGLQGMIIWSVEAFSLQDQTSPPCRYSFNITDVGLYSHTSDSFREDRQAGLARMSLPAKFKLLELQRALRSVFTLTDALDRLDWFSRLFSGALSTESGERNRWRMILDAEITAISCVTAREATDAAAKAAAGTLSDCLIPLDAFNIDGKETDALLDRWSIDGWTVEDELWSMSFAEQKAHVKRRRNFLSKAAEEGNVLQWCSVKIDGLHLWFECEIDLKEFLEGDDVVLRIGVSNQHPLTVRVSLTENVEVTCSQEGIDRDTSLGLGYLLRDFVKEHVAGALRRRDGIDDGGNVVEHLLQRLIRYLAFLDSSCVVCGSRRLLEVPFRSTCQNICRARKLNYAPRAVRSAEDYEVLVNREWRREQFVRSEFPNTWKGRRKLERLLKLYVRPASSENSYEKLKEDEIYYDLAVLKVARMKDCTKIASKLNVELSSLWIRDD